MKASIGYIKRRAVEIIDSINDPRQAIMAQRYLHLLIKKSLDSTARLELIYWVRNLLTIKILSLVGVNV